MLILENWHPLKWLLNNIQRHSGFSLQKKECFTNDSRKIVQSPFLSVMDFGNVIYMHSPASTLKCLDIVYHSTLRFITGCGFRTHRCLLYEKDGWQSLAAKRKTALHLFTTHFWANFLGILHDFLTLDQFHTALGCKTIWSSKIIILTLIRKLGFIYFAPHV